jgi:PBP1b-binding outer membrane lipoprotein LpoB
MGKKMKTKGGDKRMERKNMVWLIAIIAFVVVAMFSGCVEEEAADEEEETNEEEETDEEQETDEEAAADEEEEADEEEG